MEILFSLIIHLEKDELSHRVLRNTHDIDKARIKAAHSTMEMGICMGGTEENSNWKQKQPPKKPSVPSQIARCDHKQQQLEIPHAITRPMEGRHKERRQIVIVNSQKKKKEKKKKKRSGVCYSKPMGSL